MDDLFFKLYDDLKEQLTNHEQDNLSKVDILLLLEKSKDKALVGEPLSEIKTLEMNDIFGRS